MTQPNVYWTLNTPLVTIIGLYSNCPEGGQISDIQQNWLVGELKDADPSHPIILTVHHPIYSAYGGKPGSTRLLDASCAAARRAPDVVLSGHVHNYQRFSAPLLGKKDVPFIIAGAGGYNQRLHTLNRKFHTAEKPIRIGNEPGLLEAFNDFEPRLFARHRDTRRDRDRLHRGARSAVERPGQGARPSEVGDCQARLSKGKASRARSLSARLATISGASSPGAMPRLPPARRRSAP